jgi:hypothetical protein
MALMPIAVSKQQLARLMEAIQWAEQNERKPNGSQTRSVQNRP